MFRMTSLILCSLGIGLTYVTLREWVRNGFDLLPKDDYECVHNDNKEREGQ